MLYFRLVLIKIISNMGLVGTSAPKFSANAIINGGESVSGFSLVQYRDKKYVILFFYPKDFTFVCPSELHAFQEKLDEFKKRNCEIVGCSTDTAIKFHPDKNPGNKEASITRSLFLMFYNKIFLKFDNY